jgi:hypothetical protein
LPPRPLRPSRAHPRDHRPIKQKESLDSQIERSLYSRHDGTMKAGYRDPPARLDSIEDDSWSIGSILPFRRRRSNTKKATELDRVHQIDRRKDRRRYDGETESIASASVAAESFESAHHAKRNRITSFDSSYHPKLSPSDQLQSGKAVEAQQPAIEYLERERKWVIANQGKVGMSKTEKKVLTIHVYDPKQQVYIANCHDVSVHIHGRKIKALLIDSCSNLNVIFDTIISVFEVENSKHIGVQSTGVCPTFALDKTDGITVWMTRECMKVSNFVTSKCTEVSISIPRYDGANDWDRKEVPLPEQYVHRFQDNGEVARQ